MPESVLITPVVGEQPPASATAEERHLWLAAADLNNRALIGPASIEASKQLAASQSAMAVQMGIAAKAQEQMAQAISKPEPRAPMSDEQFVAQILVGLAQAGVTGVAAMERAKQTLNAFRMSYPKVG